MSQTQDPTQRLRRLLHYRRGPVVWIATRLSLLTLAVSVVWLMVRPEYVARTRITLLPSRSEIGYAASRPEVWGTSPAALLAQTHTEALLSRTLAADVAAVLKTEAAGGTRRGGVGAALRRYVAAPAAGFVSRAVAILNTGRWRAPDPDLALAYAIQAHTRVENLPGSFVLQISVTWGNPATAARIANLLTERYVQMALRSGQEEMRITREFIDERLRDTEARLVATEAKIRDYRVTEKLYTPSTDLDLGLQELSQYLRDYNATRVNWQQLDTRIGAMKDYQAPAALAAVEAERAGLKTRQEAVEKVIADQIAKLDKLPAKEAGLADLYRERLAQERTLSALQDRLLDTRIAEAAQLSAVRVIDPAVEPLYPERPRLLRNAVVALLAGALLGFAYVLLGEQRQAGVHGRDDLQDAGAWSAVVPQAAAEAAAAGGHAKAGFIRKLGWSAPEGSASEATVRRHLDRLLADLARDGRGRVHAFVSAAGGEGKTFLLERLARQAGAAGLRVLLVDGDWSHPDLHRRMGIAEGPGLVEWIGGRCSLQDALVPVDGHIDLLRAGAGGAAPRPAGGWTVARRQLHEQAAAYDLVLLDTPAVRRDGAAEALVGLADDWVAVAEAAASRQGDLAELDERLRGPAARFGCVLNKVSYRPDYLFAEAPAPGRG